MKYLLIFSFLLFYQSTAYSQHVVTMFEVLFFDKDKPTEKYFGMYQEKEFMHRQDSIYFKKMFESIKKSSYCIVVKRLNMYQERYSNPVGICVHSFISNEYPSYYSKIDTNTKEVGYLCVEGTAGRDDYFFEFTNVEDKPLMGFMGYVVPTKLLLQKQTQIKSDELMKFSFVLHHPKLSTLTKSDEGYIKERSKKVGVSFKKGTHLQITMKIDETLITEEDPLLDEYVTFKF